MDDGLQKKLPVDRLRQVIVAANFKRTVSIFTHRSRGQCHDRLLETAPTQLRGRLSLMDFSEEFKISGRNLVHANDEILKLFKNPRLPSIFIGDRHGSIADYHIDVSAKDISAVENYLRLMTAI